MNHAIGKIIIAVALCWFGSTTLYADQERLYGVWGTEAQCSRDLITPKGTKLAEPFKISADWLGHGEVWCRLNWSTASSTTDDLVFSFAYALCGEDAVRGHRIGFDLNGSALTLTWNDSYKVGPLMQCANE